MQLKVFFFCLLFPFFLISQERFGNEWLNKEQNYYKIEINETGEYVLTFQDLEKLGIDIKSVNPRQLKLYFLGKEVAIKIDGEEDGVFDVFDKLVFYAERNMGELDSLVYRPMSARMNKSQSLFSDKAYYFLTYNDSLGKRITYKTNLSYIIGNYQLVKETISFTEQYSFNNIIGLLPNLQQSY